MNNQISASSDFCPCSTVEALMGNCPEHPALFCVRPGISTEDALVHAVHYLKCAASTALQAAEVGTENQRGLALSAVHSVEMAAALLNAVLSDYERRASPVKAAFG